MLLWKMSLFRYISECGEEFPYWKCINYISEYVQFILFISCKIDTSKLIRSCCGRDRMVVGFTIYAFSVYHH